MAAAELTRPVGAKDEVAERISLQFAVEQFLYAEAALLDARRYRDWLALLDPAIRYWMPIRRTVTQGDIDREFTKPGDMAFFDDDFELLEMRVKKLEAGSAWSEDPPSRSRHFVTNVRITEVEGDDVTVEACFCLYRTRLASEVDTWTGRRVDVLRRHGESFRIARRHLFLDQTVIRAANMSTLF
jgi:biphenyl 2,3-dioxygenase beta subunit